MLQTWSLRSHLVTKDQINIDKILVTDFSCVRERKSALRKTSLDEWPQFINVLRGNMSLVGPRPYLLREKEDMGEYYDKIIKATPGLTGPWQIAGRSNVTFNDRLRIDNDYIDKLSLKNDIIIVLKTIGKVFKSDGAI